MPTKNILKTNLSEKGIWREISPLKIFQTFFRPLISKDSTKEIVKRHWLQKNEEKSLPKSLWRDISPPKSGPPWGGGFWKNINTKYCSLQWFMHLKGLKCWWNARVFYFFLADFDKTCAGIEKKQTKERMISKHAQASKKKQKTKHDLHKNRTGIKKNKKKQKHVIYRPPTLSRCSEFCFFCFFWCLCRFCASSGLVFWFFLMPVQVLWL